MNKNEIRQKLSEHINGGTAFMVYDFLCEKNSVEVKISQEDLAKALNKTRPSVQSALELLEEIGVIKLAYGRITFKTGLKG